MAASGTIGHGQTLTYDTGPAISVTDIISVQFSGKSTDSIEITSNATGGYYKEFIPGEIDHGTCTFTCNYKDAMYKTLADLHDARTIKTWVHTRPDSDTKTFTGFIMSDDSQHPFSGKNEMTFVIKITGLPVLAAV